MGYELEYPGLNQKVHKLLEREFKGYFKKMADDREATIPKGNRTLMLFDSSRRTFIN